MRDTEHHYRAHLVWEGNRGDGTADYATYGREYRLRIKGKPDLLGSADAAFRGDGTLHNPEDLFLAAISSCHMLSYLALCARLRVRVVAYEDRVWGVLREDGRGGGRFEEVVLSPRVTVADASQIARARELHERAHALCFIAASCSVPIHHRPEVRVAGEGAGGEADHRREPLAEGTVTGDPSPEEVGPMKDLAIDLAHRPGALAELGEALGQAGVSIEGGGVFVVEGVGHAHFLVDDATAARGALLRAGLRVLGEREVVVLRLRQDEPGQLGRAGRRMADAGVSIEVQYSDHAGNLVLVVDDLARGQDVAARWADDARR